MSSILEAIQEILPDVKIDVSGVVSFTRASVCRVLGFPDYGLTPSRQPKKLAEKLSELGFQDLRPGDYLSDTMVAVIIEYYAFDAQNINPVAVQLYRAFAAVGIRTYFQQAKGWQIEPTKQRMGLTEMKQAREGLDRLIKIMDYAEDKPGLARTLEFSETVDPTALSGLITLDDVLKSRGLEVDKGAKQAIGMYAATAYRNYTGSEPQYIIVKKRDKNGKLSSNKIAAYPAECLPILENAIDFGYKS